MPFPARPTEWPPSNYVNPPTRGSPSLFIVTMVMSTVVVLLRVYSRRFLTKCFGLDDAFLVAGWFLSLGMTFAEIKAMTTWGWNKHIWDIRPDKLPDLRLAAWLIEFFFLLGNACTKVSILLFYRRITSGLPGFWFLYLAWAAIAFTVLYTLGLLIELFVICRPLESYWESYNPLYTKKYTCGNEHIPFIFSAAASVTSDIYSSVLPMMLARTLQMTRKQRFSLYALFSAGLLTAGTGLARLIVFIPVTTNYTIGPHTHDVSWLGWPLLALTDIEAHLAIIIASLPALKVFFRRRLSGPLRRISDSIRTTSHSSRTSSGAMTLPPSHHVIQHHADQQLPPFWLTKQPVRDEITTLCDTPGMVRESEDDQLPSHCNDELTDRRGAAAIPRYIDVVEAARIRRPADVHKFVAGQ